MRTLLRSGCLLLVILGLQGIAAVEDRAAALFRKWDRNNDGKLTRQERPAEASRACRAAWDHTGNSTVVSRPSWISSARPTS